jgi:FkbH-like protein
VTRRDTDPPAAGESLAEIIAYVETLDAKGPVHEQTVRISLLRNYTVESMVPLLKYHCYRAGLQPAITVGEYDNIGQEVRNPDSHVYAGNPDCVVVSILLEHLDPQCLRSDWDPSLAREAILATLAELVGRSRALVVVNTLLPPLHVENVAGSRRPDHRVAKVHALNAEIRQFAEAHRGQVFVLEWERILQMFGEERSLDPRFWYMYRSPFKKDFLARYASEIVTLVCALKGKTKKCLVLDCDNTLWGGVVGEDGLEGIALDPHDFPGRCFHDFQQSVVNLIDLGVVVALCSKNNEADVWEVLEKHPHSLLKRTHLAAWRVNWENKAENIAALAKELNLGLDSFVFVDDSELECQLVSQMLPEVTVLPVPKRLYELPKLLVRDGLFDVLTVSHEDRQRTAMYVTERERAELKAGAGSGDEYLASLGIRAVIHPAREAELPRVAQLFSKTNQFNLTTRRLSEEQLRDLAQGPDSVVFTMTAGDRFGDLGLIAVLTARRDGSAGVIDSLLMSCRALGRRLEQAFVDHALTHLERQWGVREWRAEYIPTRKNGQVEGFWDQTGFEPVQTGPAGTVYRLDATRRVRPAVDFITIEGA